MKNLNKLHYILIFLLVLVGCRPVNPPVRPVQRASEYVLGYEESYGRFYGDSVPYRVFALDLYSEGVSLDSTGHIVGTGWNLYLSDIFLSLDSDSLLSGEYHSSSSPEAFTFLPGVFYEDMPHGAYLLQIEDGGIAGISTFSDGVMTITHDGDTTDASIHFVKQGVTRTDTIYSAHFRGVLNRKKGA